MNLASPILLLVTLEKSDGPDSSRLHSCLRYFTSFAEFAFGQKPQNHGYLEELCIQM